MVRHKKALSDLLELEKLMEESPDPEVQCKAALELLKRVDPSGEYFRQAVYPRVLERSENLLDSTNYEIRMDTARCLLQKFDPPQLPLLKTDPKRAIERARQIVREQKEHERKLHPPN